jgi:ubiquinone/menaquinone biosynthesis C-methylase UbiE
MRNWTFPKWAVSGGHGHGHGSHGQAPRQAYHLLAQHIELVPGARILDVGCGSGALLTLLAEGRDFVGYGVDVDPNMIAQAKKNCPQMDFSVAPSDKLPFADQDFDVLIVCMAFHHFGDKSGFAAQAARVLRPNGMLYIAELTLPGIARNTVNGLLQVLRIHGGFVRPQEITALFSRHGFRRTGSAADGHIQLVKLRKDAATWAA